MTPAVPPLSTETATKTNHADDLRKLERRRLLDALTPLLAEGKTYAECAALLGKSAATLCRLVAAWKNGGTDELKTKHGNAGRKKLARVGPGGVFTEADVAFVKRLAIQSESLPLALERLSDVGHCSAEARDLIDQYREKGDYPPSFYTLFHVTAEEWALARGEKHFQGVTYNARRGMWMIDEDGVRRELFAGDLVEADDVSVDVPYYVQLPDGSYSVGRQLLMFRDVRSRKWLGAYAVARDRDSYRGEDIARACRELILSWGLVGRFRFERGAWESEPVAGIKVGDGDKRWGGIAQLIPTTNVFTSNAKGGIEGNFFLMHKVLGEFGVRIGKTRGEYEEPTADMLAVNAGRKDPRACGFIAWADLLTVFDRAFTRMNGRPKKFQELAEKAAPDDVWAKDMQARPGGRLPSCPADMLWHFLPVKREVSASVVQAGHVKVSVAGYPLPFFFRIGGPNPAEGGAPFPFIERGHKLIVAFDPQRAAEGAVIFNSERGPMNTQGWRPLQRLFVAPPGDEAPQIDLSGRAGQAPNVVAAKVRNQQVRAAFTDIGLYGQGARHVRQDHDGKGNISRVERGAPARTQVAAPVAHGPRVEVAAVPFAGISRRENLGQTPGPVATGKRGIRVEEFYVGGERMEMPPPKPVTVEEIDMRG